MGTIGRKQLPPLHRAFDPDEILDFHASRLVILLEICGRGTRARRIDGRTKLAKLDFFLRYPRFLERAQGELARRGRPHTAFTSIGPEREAPMIRYRYGPWDPDYREYVAFLQARGLVRIVGTNVEGISLTARGRSVAGRLLAATEFRPLVERAEAMIGNLSGWTGSALKDFIYEVFQQEIAELPMREEIEP
jgi:hypothetical protein